MANSSRMINGARMRVQFATIEAGFSNEDQFFLDPGEAAPVSFQDPGSFIARDAHSLLPLSIQQAQHLPNSLLIVEDDLSSNPTGGSIKLQITNSTNAAIEVCQVADRTEEEVRNGAQVAKLAPNGSIAIDARAENIYVAKVYASGAPIQTFVTSKAATQAFDVTHRSTGSDVSASIAVTNYSTLSLVLQWVDFDGTLRRSTPLEPGQRTEQSTFLSHPWILRDAYSGLVVDALTAGHRHQDWVFRADTLRSIGGTKPTTVEFWNATAYPVTLILRDFDGNESVADTLLPGARRNQPTFAGHVWKMVDARSQKGIKTFLPSPQDLQLCGIIPRNEQWELPPMITFDNDAGLTVELVAKDLEGVERVYASLPNRGIHLQPTTTADSWFVRDQQSGSVLEEVVTSQEDFTHLITAKGIHSREMQVPVEAVFENTTPFTVDVSWIDYDGQEEPFYRLKPGEQMTQPTHATHVWRFRERETRDILHLFVADKTPRQRVEVVMRPIRSREPAVIRFRNYTGLTTEVVWFDAEGKPSVLRTLIPGRQAAFKTFATHAWVFRDKESGTVMRTVIAQPGEQTITLNPTDIRSKRSDRGTKLIFKNQMPFKVDIHWIDYEGKETPHETLRPGERLEKNSYTTQPYRFRHHLTKREVGVFLPKDAARQAVNIALRAYEDRIKTKVEIRNMTSLTVKVYKVDHSGNESFQFELLPRDGQTVETFSTHPIIVRDKVSNEAIAYTIAGDKPQRLDVTSEGLRSNRTDYPVWITWKNKLKLTVELYWVKYDGSEEHMRTIQPGESHEISTYPTHVWRAKYKRSGTEVDLYIAGEADKQTREIGTVPPLRTRERPGGVLWPGEVALYEHANFEGRVWIAHGDLPDFEIESGFNDAISSLKVGPDTAVSVFKDAYFNALPQDLKIMATEVREAVEAAFQERLAKYREAVGEIMTEMKAGQEAAFIEQVNNIQRILEKAADQAPRQVSTFMERFVAGTGIPAGGNLRTISPLDHGGASLESELREILQSRILTDDRKAFAEAVKQALLEVQEAILDAFVLEWNGSLDESIRDSAARKTLDALETTLENAAKVAGVRAEPLVQKPASDVFHVDVADLDQHDIKQDKISSIQVLRNISPETLRITSTNKVADDPRVVNGQMVRDPKYRTTIQFPPEVREVQLWGTEEMKVQVGDTEYEIGPKDDQYARVKPRMGGTLILQVRPDKIGVPAIMLRTNSMPVNGRVFIFPDADVHRKFVQMDEDAFINGIPDGNGGRRQLATKPGASQEDIRNAQKAIQSLSSTPAAAKTAGGSGTAADQRLIVNRMDMSAFRLDFGEKAGVSDAGFRPVDPQKVLQEAANAEQLGQGFFDFIEDVGEGIASVAVAAVDTVGDAFEDAGDWFEDAGNAIAQGFEDFGEMIVDGFEAIGDAFEEMGEWIGDRIEEGLAFLEDVIEEATEFFEDIGEAISQGLQVIVEAAGRIVTVVVDTLEKVGEVVMYVATKIVEAVESVIDFICSLFSWGDILKTHDVLGRVVDKAFGVADDGIVKLQQKTGAFISKARKEMGSIMSQARQALGVEDLDHVKEESDESDAMDALMWLFDKLSAIGGGAADLIGSAKEKLIEETGIEVPSLGPSVHIGPEIAGELEELGKIFRDLLKNVAQEGLEAGQDAVESIITRLGDILEDPGRAPQLLVALFLDIGEIFIDTGLAIAGEMANAFFRLGRVLLKLVKAIIDTEIDLPIISDLYEFITDGRKLTVRSITCLLLAIPVTIAGKLAVGVDNFNSEVLAQWKDPGNGRLFGYGFCHILLGLTETARDTISAGRTSEADYDSLKFILKRGLSLTFGTVIAAGSWILSLIAIGLSGPYKQGSPLSWTCWSMQVVEFVLDVGGEVAGWRDFIKEGKGMASKIGKVIVGLNIAAGVGHLILNGFLLGEEYEAEGEPGKHLLATGYVATTLPVILGGILNVKKWPVPATVIIIAGKTISQFTEGGTMIALASVRDNK